MHGIEFSECGNIVDFRFVNKGVSKVSTVVCQQPLVEGITFLLFSFSEDDDDGLLGGNGTVRHEHSCKCFIYMLSFMYLARGALVFFIVSLWKWCVFVYCWYSWMQMSLLISKDQDG